MAVIGNIIQPRKEVIKRDFQGVLQAHKADKKGDSLESSPERFFQITYPSNRIREIIGHVNAKLKGENSQGTVVLTGPYGSGKSHGLIALYHLFKNPREAGNWAKTWDIELPLPQQAEAVIVSTLDEDPRFLWEPILKKSGRTDLLTKVERFAPMQLIQELAAGKVFAIILDELETWYVSMEKANPDYLERNRSFLQCLLEVAADPQYKLFVFVSTLGKATTLEEILARTSPPREDMSTTDDRNQILWHRLFQTSARELDKNAVNGVVKQYVKAYESLLSGDEQLEMERRMVRSYPFHPQLLDLLDDLYESPASQSVRGQMAVLAESIADSYRSTDLITVADLNHRAFRGMNLELVGRYDLDVSKRLQSDALGQEMLKVILMFSLSGIRGSASEKDVLLGCYKTSMKGSLTDLSMELGKLVGKAVYLHNEHGKWMIKGEENVIALVEREALTVSAKESEKVILETLKEQVFNGQVYIYESEKELIPDDQKTKYVVLGKSLGTIDSVRRTLIDFCKDRQWGNTLVFIAPVGEGPLESPSLIDKSRRIAAAEGLKSHLAEASDKIDEIIEEEKEQLARGVESRYGHIVFWTKRNNGELDITLKRAPADIEKIRSILSTDESQLEEWLLERLQTEDRGIKIDWLIQALKRHRGAPVLTDDQIVYDLIPRMLNERKIAVQGERGKYLSSSEIVEVAGDYIILKPEAVPERRTMDKTDSLPSGGESAEQESPISGPTAAEGEKGAQTSRIAKDVKRDSVPALISSLDAELNEETDLIVEVELRLEDLKLSKDELIGFLQTIPKDYAIRLHLEVDRLED